MCLLMFFASDVADGADVKSKPHAKTDTARSSSQRQSGKRSVKNSAGNPANNPPDWLGLRDPEESSQGPLRFDDTNYSPRNLSLPEGNANVYADEYESSFDEDENVRRNAAHPRDPETVQQDILDDLDREDADPLGPAAPADLGADIPETWQTAGQTDDARSDLGILDEVNDVLSGFMDSEVARIEVTVKDGIVVLDGETAEATHRTRIEQAIDAIPAVRSVRNHLSVRGECEQPRWSDK